jgi:hypothetical protein
MTLPETTWWGKEAAFHSPVRHDVRTSRDQERDMWVEMFWAPAALGALPRSLTGRMALDRLTEEGVMGRLVRMLRFSAWVYIVSISATSMGLLVC